MDIAMMTSIISLPDLKAQPNPSMQPTFETYEYEYDFDERLIHISHLHEDNVPASQKAESANEKEIPETYTYEYEYDFDERLHISHLHEDNVPASQKPESANEKEIPETFDARTKWEGCWSLEEVRDQSNCGSCWAVATASAASDRLCIVRKWYKKQNDDFDNPYQDEVSAADIMSCCLECRREGGNGCDGGSIFKTWEYLKNVGVCNGGSWNAELVPAVLCSCRPDECVAYA
ncbi:unnamed protein product [Strongylus vulgaris]|uniref:Peptidase C1A papain C-terminal domain-containing protein n=1 Tax=Strongylus vulgaris TaxID=40348 RepID=A0A3P7JD31_STRVU|nr:unnamed protein product [Strongylus vulgaris]